MKSHGVVYIAFGLPYLILAYRSIASLKSVCSQVPVCVLIDRESAALIRGLPEGWNAEDCFLVIDDSPDNNRYIKTSLNKYSPFDKTLFLDADTLVKSDISDIFSYLESFDLCLRLYGSGSKKGVERSALPLLDGAYRVSDLPHWNSGVIAFNKCNEVDSFFAAWSANYQKHRHEMRIFTDQGALVEAMFESKVRFLSLDSRWNCLTSERAYFVNPDNRIVHNCYFKWSDRKKFNHILKLKFEEPDNLHKIQVRHFLASQERKRVRKFTLMIRLIISFWVSKKDWV